ncbi:MAG: CNNM domain-containing protein [candidate division WOR-3 bacterium]
MLLILIAIILVLLIGIFTSSETAFLSVDKTKVLYSAEEKKPWALITKKFIQKPAEFFSTILVCEDFLIVIASNLMSIYFISKHGENWVFLSTILLSFFSLIFGQLIPKSIALLYPERTLAITTRMIVFFRTLLLPIVSLFAGISQSLASFFKTQSIGAIIRHRDIVFAISEYEKDTSLLAARLFDFSKRKVFEIMVPINMALVCRKGEDFKKLCFESDRIFRYVPILDMEKNEVIGIINTKDYFLYDSVQVNPPFFINENEKCMQVFLKMKEKKEHIAVIQDKNHTAVGIITIYDLIEELVGAIREER